MNDPTIPATPIPAIPARQPMTEVREDRYDRAVAYLTASPDSIQWAWESPKSHPAGCLFLFTSPNGSPASNPEGRMCGCLTMVRNSYPAWTPELTEAIRVDASIPLNARDITPAHLPAFAKWQRILDGELRRDWNEA